MTMMCLLTKKRAVKYLVIFEVLLTCGIAESGESNVLVLSTASERASRTFPTGILSARISYRPVSGNNFTCLQIGVVPHPNNLRRKFCSCKTIHRPPDICFTCPEGETFDTSGHCVSSNRSDWDFVCSKTGHMAHPSIRRSFCSCKNRTKPPIFCYFCKEGNLYDAERDVCRDNGESIVPVPTTASKFASRTFSTGILSARISYRPAPVLSTEWISRASVSAVPATVSLEAAAEGIPTLTTISAVSKTLINPLHRTLCTQAPMEETLQCYKAEIERHMQNLRNIHSKDVLQTFLKRILNDTRGLLNICSSQKNRNKGFEVIEALENAERQIASRVFNNTWRSLSAFTEDLVVDMTLTNGSHEFPKNILKRTFRRPWGQIDDVLIMEDNMLNKDQYPRLAVISWYRNLHNFVPVNLYGFNESFEVNSHVMSALLYPPITGSFNGEVVVILKHNKALEDGEFPICAFWNFSIVTSNDRGAWSPFGCHVDSEKSNKTYTACRCTHLTNFALLMGSDQSSVSEDDKLVLSVITYVGCALSLFGTVGALASILMFTGLTSDRNIIHANLLASLAIAHIIFLAGINETKNKVQCKLTAILLHYFYLVSFGWMLCEGLHLYFMVIKVFNLSSKIYYYVVFAWGIPAIVILVSAGIRYKEYGTPSSCWISGKVDLQLAFILPIGVTLLANVAILCLVIKETCSLQRTGRCHVSHFLKSTLKSLVILIPLLGITWIFGLLLFATKEMVFQYLFALFNTAQGFFIFLLHYVFNSEVRNKFHRRKEGLKDLKAIRYIRRKLSCSVAPLVPKARATSLLERVATFNVTSDSSSKKDAF